MIHFSMEPLVFSPRLQRLLIGVGVIVLLLATFTAGVHVGERKARHFSGWYKNTRPLSRSSRPQRPTYPFNRMPMPLEHGVFGKVLSISDHTVMVEGKDGLEQQVQVSTSTSIRLNQDQRSLQDLQTGVEISVFGRPLPDGSIQAHLIRLLPHQR